MLSNIKNSILSKAVNGLMLVSITLSFSGGILWTSAKMMPTVKTSKSGTRILSKSNIGKQEKNKANQSSVIKETTNQANMAQAASANTVATGKPVANNVGQRPVKSPKYNSTSNVDLYLLARIIYAESRGEPIQGQVGVGAVLLNRLKDSRFPKSLSGIIFKQGEFCTVRDGQIWKTPNQEAIKAAHLAVAGWDPTGGALYFYNPAKTTSRWIWSRPIVNKIGNHIFAI